MATADLIKRRLAAALQQMRRQLNTVRLPSSLSSINRLPILTREATAQKIAHLLQADTPFLLSRLGTTETQLINELASGLVTSSTRSKISALSGVFPTDKQSLEHFASIYETALTNVDLLAVRDEPIEKTFWGGEKLVITRLALKPTLVPLEAIFPFNGEPNWLGLLGGKRVLVILPFSKEVKSQHQRWDSLFLPENKFPDFELEVIESPQFLSDHPDRQKFGSWAEGLRFLKEEVSKSRSEIALIGAGALGLPVGYECKRMGMKVIHLGGATQLLFGITGRRWESDWAISRIANSSWIRPHIDEGFSYDAVEGGCYW